MKNPQRRYRDLLGPVARERKSRLQMTVERYHRATAEAKVERLRWLQRVFPRGSALFVGLEPYLVFEEAKMTFLDGHFVGTLLLAFSFIEHVFAGILRARGFDSQARGGMKTIIKCLRANSLADAFLLDRAERLRRSRNPFVHLKPFDSTASESTLMNRSFSMGQDPFAAVEADARDALTLMYQVARGKGTAK